MLYWENSLEADPSKRAGAHNCLQARDRYRQLVGEVQGKRKSQVELPGRSMDRNILPQPSATPEIMVSFFEAGWETSSNWLKVCTCYSLGMSLEFSVSQM
jgi:hypothetical protein